MDLQELFVRIGSMGPYHCTVRKIYAPCTVMWIQKVTHRSLQKLLWMQLCQHKWQKPNLRVLVNSPGAPSFV